MGRFGFDVKLFAAAIDKKVAITDAGMKLEARLFQLSCKQVEQRAGILIGNAAGGVIFHDAIDDRDEIAAENPIGGTQRDSLRSGFERGAAGMVFLGGI